MCSHIACCTEILHKHAVAKTLILDTRRVLYANTRGIMLKFLDRISKFPLLPVTSSENSPMEVFHILTTCRRKLTLIIKEFYHITQQAHPANIKPSHLIILQCRMPSVIVLTMT